jgi:glycosyltransferase involved in cell wall biosynthesis
VPEPSTVLVVPCFNEAARLRADDFRAGLRDDPDLRLLFVDDGSKDGTAARLTALAALEPGRIDVVVLAANAGKGEAVRRGLLEALRKGPRYVGYWDADLATPLDAAAGLRRVLDEQPAVHLAIGSRIQRLGSTISRSALRHYVGRVIATFASRTVRLPVYDTQCGAKVFRVTPWLPEMLAEPFLSRWLFDVEILARFGRLAARGVIAPATTSVYEVPLVRWIDEPGSKVRALDFFRALRDLARIRRAYPPGRP